MSFIHHTSSQKTLSVAVADLSEEFWEKIKNLHVWLSLLFHLLWAGAQKFAGNCYVKSPKTMASWCSGIIDASGASDSGSIPEEAHFFQWKIIQMDFLRLLFYI